LLRLRALNPEKGSPAWQDMKCATSTIVGTGLLEGKQTTIVAHRGHPLMTADGILRFKDYIESYDNGAIILPEDQVLKFINPHRNNTAKRRDVWVIQDLDLSKIQYFFETRVGAIIPPLLASFMGSEIDSDQRNYLNGFYNNVGNYIQFLMHRRTDGRLSFKPLCIDFDRCYLNADDDFNSVCVLGVREETLESFLD